MSSRWSPAQVRVHAALSGAGDRRRTATVIFFACLAVYHANLRPISQADTVPAPYAAWALVQHSNLELQHYPYLAKFVGGPIRSNDDGSWISIYPPGSSLAAVPFVLPLALVLDEPLNSGLMRRIGKLAGASASALAVVFFWLTCVRLLPRETPAATLLFAFGTGLWSVASQSLWQHGPATLWLTVALYAAGEACSRGSSEPSRSAGYEISFGVALAMAVATRTPTALFAVAFGLAFAARATWSGRWRAGIGFAIPFCAMLIYNEVVHGAPVSGGYSGHLTWESPWTGAVGLLFAPSRGLFVYSPALMFAVVGFFVLSRDRGILPTAMRNQVIAGAVATAMTWLLYSAFWQPWGGWSFGPRYLIETTPVLCLLVAIASRKMSDYSIRTATWLKGAIAISIFIQFLGVFGDDYGAWHRRHRDEANAGVFSLQDSQIEAHIRYLLRL